MNTQTGKMSDEDATHQRDSPLHICFLDGLFPVIAFFSLLEDSLIIFFLLM